MIAARSPGILRRSSYGEPDDDAFDRVRFYARCSALEDLAYGRATGAHQYTRAAERSLQWLFGS